MSWSPQQETAIRDVQAWINDRKGKQVFRVFGYAGTGKTTIAKELAEQVKGKVLFATFTGKASLVLRSKGCEGATTIHSLIYSVEVDPQTGEASFKLNEDSDLSRAALLIIDEVSMVGEDLAADLLSFGKRVLVLGDPAQLPPVKGQGYFIDGEPDVMLTEVHRQARDNPIIQMSMDVREGRGLSIGAYGQSIVTTQRAIGKDGLAGEILKADQLLCGLNRTRTSFNARVRELKGLAGKDCPWHPSPGDRLICLRNRKEKGLFNGGIWNASSIRKAPDAKLRMIVESMDEDRDPLGIEVFEHFFNGTDHQLDWRAKRGTEEFTYGWAITCHKSQGSQWDNVIVYDESKAFGDDRAKWLYTAITRAADRVVVVQ